jgi:ubiquinol-cytochrome c reductase cytochrome c subunit
VTTRERRRQAAAIVGVVAGLSAVVMLLLGARASAQSNGQSGAQSDQVDRGRQLYETGCVSCHGPDGGGVTLADGASRGPSIKDAGEAGAYYQLSTGRMPLAQPSDEPVRKRPAYGDEDINALVAYVATLGNGPPLPNVNVEGADLANGGELFRANCAPCHSAAGAGGALSYGNAAPPLSQSQPLQVGAAVRSGPGQMPVFSPDVIDDHQLNDVAAYVQYLRHPQDPGGIPIGRTGPVPEGFVAWFFGMGAFIAFVVWIGTRSPIRRRRDPTPGRQDAELSDA